MRAPGSAVISSASTRARGASMVEFMLILPLFLFIFMMMAQFGLILHANISLAHATNVGARLASVRRSNEEVVAAVVASAGPTITLPPANVTVDVANPNEIAGTGDKGIPVSAFFYYPVTLPFIRDLFPSGSIRLTSTSTMRLE